MANEENRYIPRLIDLEAVLKNKSCFLFGPRQTGKSLLIRKTLPRYRVYNLLETDTYLRFSRKPELLRQECRPEDRCIVIDEIQKLPSLLDEVQLLIEERGIKFLLTGSSARKLKRSGVNLLGGRARVKYLYPFSYMELKDRFDLTRALNNGLLPSLYLSQEPADDLQTYVGTYLKEEIAAEGLTRNIPAFSRFLEVAAACNGQLINYTKIASDAQVARSTVQEYFQILKDTLIAFELPCWQASIKRKPLSTSKFYFFDPGVARFLQNRKEIAAGSPEFGELFETFIFNELNIYSQYRGNGQLAYWRSKSGYEVDFIVDGETAVEVKASTQVGLHDLRGLKALREEKKMKSHIVICFQNTPRTVDGISVLPWHLFLKKLWEKNRSKASKAGHTP